MSTTYVFNSHVTNVTMDIASYADRFIVQFLTIDKFHMVIMMDCAWSPSELAYYNE